MAKAHIKRLKRAAARVQHLNDLIDGGDFAARKVKKMMQGTWEKRTPSEQKLFGFFDQKKAREMKRAS